MLKNCETDANIIDASIEYQKRILKLQSEFLDPYTSCDRRNDIMDEESFWFNAESQYLNILGYLKRVN